MTTTDEARAELVNALVQHPWLENGWPSGFCPTCNKVIEAGYNSPAHAEHLADSLLAAGYRKVSDHNEFNDQVQAERQRQIAKGYNQEHDDKHGVDHLLMWAQEYARRGEPVKVAALIEAAREAFLRRASPARSRSPAKWWRLP